MNEEEFTEKKEFLKEQKNAGTITGILYPFRRDGRKKLMLDRITFTYWGIITQVFDKHFKLINKNGKEYFLKIADIIDIFISENNE